MHEAYYSRMICSKEEVKAGWMDGRTLDIYGYLKARLRMSLTISNNKFVRSGNSNLQLGGSLKANQSERVFEGRGQGRLLTELFFFNHS